MWRKLLGDVNIFGSQFYAPANMDHAVQSLPTCFEIIAQGCATKQKGDEVFDKVFTKAEFKKVRCEYTAQKPLDAEFRIDGYDNPVLVAILDHLQSSGKNPHVPKKLIPDPGQNFIELPIPSPDLFSRKRKYIKFEAQLERVNFKTQILESRLKHENVAWLLNFTTKQAQAHGLLASGVTVTGLSCTDGQPLDANAELRTIGLDGAKLVACWPNMKSLCKYEGCNIW